VIKNRSSFSLGVNGMRSYDTPNLNAALPGGVRSEALPLRAYRNNLFVNGLWNLAVTPDQTLRVSYNHSSNINEKLGVSDYNLPERAYATENGVAPVTRPARRTAEAAFLHQYPPDGEPDVVVFTFRARSADDSGRGCVHARRTTNRGRPKLDARQRGLRSRLRARHSFDAGRHPRRQRLALSDDHSNYLGTYTFESLEAFDADTPLSFTRRVGDPRIRYRSVQAGLYIQDDIR
jgi:hypothetical protein